MILPQLLVNIKHFPENNFRLLIFIGNTLKALTITKIGERNFNDRLLVSLGFVKVRKLCFFL